MNISDHLSIGWHLMRREAYVAFGSLKTDAIDITVMTLSALFTFGYFMPGMGMPTTLCLPTYLGAVVVMALFFGFIRGGNMSIDLGSAKTTHFYTALPASLWVSLGVPVLSSMLRIMLFTVPSGVFGVWWLGHKSVLVLSWWRLGVMVTLGHLFLALLFMIALYQLTTDQYYGDLWPRLLGPMFSFGCLFFTWQGIARVAPQVAKLLLLNPMVHIIEGVRGAVFDPSLSLPFAMTSLVLTGLSAVFIVWYARAASRRLELVIQKRST